MRQHPPTHPSSLPREPPSAHSGKRDKGNTTTITAIATAAVARHYIPKRRKRCRGRWPIKNRTLRKDTYLWYTFTVLPLLHGLCWGGEEKAKQRRIPTPWEQGGAHFSGKSADAMGATAGKRPAPAQSCWHDPLISYPTLYERPDWHPGSATELRNKEQRVIVPATYPSLPSFLQTWHDLIVLCSGIYCWIRRALSS